jgi:AraC-like DNA-binding protein
MCKHTDTALPEDAILLSGLLLELIYTLSKDSARYLRVAKENGNREKTIEATLAYIKDHLTEDLSLPKVAEIMSFSPIHFHNSFRAATGKTLHDYVENQRIKKSIDLLISSEMNLTQIAYECGFSSQSYFSYAFKRRMKCSPREYAKTILQTYEK